MDNEVVIQRKALCLAHFLYRNTIIEDYHSEGVTMDLQLYEEIKSIVKQGLKLINENAGILDSIFEQKDKEKIIRSANLPIVREVIFNMLMGNDWDAPTLLVYNGSDAPENYILDGVFLDFCKLHKPLSDTNMKILNKDIHSRIYTLIKNKII